MQEEFPRDVAVAAEVGHVEVERADEGAGRQLEALGLTLVLGEEVEFPVARQEPQVVQGLGEVPEVVGLRGIAHDLVQLRVRVAGDLHVVAAAGHEDPSGIEVQPVGRTFGALLYGVSRAELPVPVSGLEPHSYAIAALDGAGHGVAGVGLRVGIRVRIRRLVDVVVLVLAGVGLLARGGQAVVVAGVQCERQNCQCDHRHAGHWSPPVVFWFISDESYTA